MYNLIKDVISNGNYELSNLLKKIDMQWIQGNITDGERNELVQYAQERANAQYSLDIVKKLEELDKRVKALEEAAKVEDDPTEEGTTEGEVEVDYPEFEPGKWYYAGDIISFEGSNYKCVAPEGTVCVWTPADYPTYWQMVTAE